MQAMTKLESAGFTRSEIASRLGVQRQAVGHWVRNRNAPAGPQIAALIALGRERGVTFLAEDFLPAPRSEAA